MLLALIAWLLFWPDSKQVGWNKRYFVITGNVLYYFKTQEVDNLGATRACTSFVC